MENWANCPNIIGTGWSWSAWASESRPCSFCRDILPATKHLPLSNYVENMYEIRSGSWWLLAYDGWTMTTLGEHLIEAFCVKKTSVSNFNVVYHLPGSFSVFILPRTGISRWKKALQSQYAIYGVCRSVQHTSGKLMLQQGANQCPPHIPSKGHHLGADSSKTNIKGWNVGILPKPMCWLVEAPN